MVGTDYARLGLGRSSRDGVNLPKIFSRRRFDRVDLLEPLLFNARLFHHPRGFDRQDLQLTVVGRQHPVDVIGESG